MRNSQCRRGIVEPSNIVPVVTVYGFGHAAESPEPAGHRRASPTLRALLAVGPSHLFKQKESCLVLVDIARSVRSSIWPSMVIRSSNGIPTGPGSGCGQRSHVSSPLSPRKTRLEFSKGFAEIAPEPANRLNRPRTPAQAHVGRLPRGLRGARRGVGLQVGPCDGLQAQTRASAQRMKARSTDCISSACSASFRIIKGFPIHSAASSPARG